MMKKISVIVPIYNAELYLKKCLDSIINQTYSNFEVILINDGSTDKSKDICMEFCENDERLIYIEQENKGLSSARNIGISKSSGDYICFVDSDDYIEKELFKKTIHAIDQYNADIIIYGRYKDYGTKIVKVFESRSDKIYKKEVVLKKMLSGIKMDFSVCDKIFKKELWKSIRFPVGLTAEDMLTVPYVIEQAKKIVKIKGCYYYYRYTPNSITTSKFNQHTFDSIRAIEFFENKYLKGKLDERLHLNAFKVIQYTFYIQKLISLDENNINYERNKYYLNYLRRKIVIILFNPFIKLKTKFNAVMATMPKVYRSYLRR